MQVPSAAFAVPSIDELNLRENYAMPKTDPGEPMLVVDSTNSGKSTQDSEAFKEDCDLMGSTTEWTSTASTQVPDESCTSIADNIDSAALGCSPSFEAIAQIRAQVIAETTAMAKWKLEQQSKTWRSGLSVGDNVSVRSQREGNWCSSVVTAADGKLVKVSFFQGTKVRIKVLPVDSPDLRPEVT